MTSKRTMCAETLTKHSNQCVIHQNVHDRTSSSTSWHQNYKINQVRTLSEVKYVLQKHHTPLKTFYYFYYYEYDTKVYILFGMGPHIY